MLFDNYRINKYISREQIIIHNYIIANEFYINEIVLQRCSVRCRYFLNLYYRIDEQGCD